MRTVSIGNLAVGQKRVVSWELHSASEASLIGFSRPVSPYTHSFQSLVKMVSAFNTQPRDLLIDSDLDEIPDQVFDAIAGNNAPVALYV